MPSNIKQQLNSLKNSASPLNPDALWMSANRERLLIQTRNTVGTKKTAEHTWTWNNLAEAGKIFIPVHTWPIMRSMASSVLVVVLTIGSWIASVSASYNSLPGETLYKVKLATEKTELLVATVIGSDTEKVNTLLKHASHRVEEYKNSKSSVQATEVLQSLNSTIKSTNETLNEVNKSAPEKAIQVAQAVNEKTDKILQALGETTLLLPTAVGTSSADSALSIRLASLPLDQEVQKTSSLVEAAGVRAVEVLVENTGSAQSQADQKDVKAQVEKKLEKVVTDIAVISDSASTTLAKAIPVVVAPNSSTTTASTTAKIGIAEVVAEAKDLIEKNDLLGAIKKVQELQVAKGEAQTAADVANSTVSAPVTAPITATGTLDVTKPTIIVTTTK